MKKLACLAVIGILFNITGISIAWSLNLTGKILDVESGNAIFNANVDLWEYNNPMMKQSFTSSADGSYSFYNLISGGHYHLIGSYTGYIDTSSSTLNPYDTVDDFILDLVPTSLLSELLTNADTTAGYVLGYVNELNVEDTGVEGVAITVTDFDGQPITGAIVFYLDENRVPWDKNYTSTSGLFIIYIPANELDTHTNLTVGYPTTFKDINIIGQRNGWVIASGPWTRVFRFSSTERNIITIYDTTGEDLSSSEDSGSNDDGGDSGGGGGCFIVTAL
jgi:hypothetical protein